MTKLNERQRSHTQDTAAMIDVSERLIALFSRVAAAGAEFELRARLLCGVVPAIDSQSTAHRLEDVEDAIVSHFSASLNQTDRDSLARARKLRNKVLHADFHAARKRLTEIDGVVPPNVTRQVKLEEGRAAEQLRRIAQDPSAHGIEIGASDSTADGTVFGWLLEFASTGEFQRAYDAFRSASALIERLRSATED